MFNPFILAEKYMGGWLRAVKYRRANFRLPRQPKYKLSIYVENAEQESIVQKLIRDDLEFRKGIEEIARKLSDKYSETR